MAMGCGSSLRTSSARVRPRLVRRSRMVRTSAIASSRRSRATMSFSTSSVFSSIAFLSSVNSSSDRRRVRRRVLLLLTIRTFSCALPVRILRWQVYLAGAVSSFFLEFVSRRPTSALRNRKADETRAETEETGSRVFHQPTAPCQLAQRRSSRSCFFFKRTRLRFSQCNEAESLRREAAPPPSGLKTHVSGLASIAFVQTQTLATAAAVDYYGCYPNPLKEASWPHESLLDGRGKCRRRCTSPPWNGK